MQFAFKDDCRNAMKKRYELEKIIEEIKAAGKLQKLALYASLIKKQYELHEVNFITTYNSAYEIYQDYLNFDKHPPKEVSNHLLEIFYYAFKIIRASGKVKNLKRMQQEFYKYEKHFSDNEKLAMIYSNLNFFSWQQGDHKKALSNGLKSLGYIEKSGNDFLLPGRYSNIGYIYESMGDYRLAESFYEKGLNYGFRINSSKVKKLAYCGYGRLHLNQGNAEAAIDNLLEAEKYSNNKESDDHASISCNLGIAYGMKKDYTKSLSYFIPYANDEVKAENPDLYFTCLMNMANCYLIQKEYLSAEKNLISALQFAKDHNIEDDMTGILINLGLLETARGNYNAAHKYYEESQKLNSLNYNLKKDILIDQGMGNIYRNKGEDKKAIEYYLSSIKKAKDQTLNYEVASIYQKLSQLYEKQGDYKSALTYYKRSKEIETESAKHDNQPLPSEDISQKSADITKLIPFDSLISSELAKKINSPLIGNGNVMRDVLHQAKLAAQNINIAVLLTGESGTGKEVIARIIHFSSQRAKKPLISVNCASISHSLIESSFFGYEPGAFTGAKKRTIGYFEAADKSSLFLDEIGEMPLSMQSKFLRVLEEKKIHLMGSVRNVETDFRLISATNKDLNRMIKDKNFRLDLFNRINTLEINLPPLRDRKEDIPPLIDYFITRFCHDMDKKKPLCSKEALELLLEYSFPGNVRELMNIIKRSLLFSQNSVLMPQDIIFPPKEKDSIPQVKSLDLYENEMNLIKLAMKRAGNHQIKAAALLGISPSSLCRKLKKTRLEK